MAPLAVASQLVVALAPLVRRRRQAAWSAPYSASNAFSIAASPEIMRQNAIILAAS
jgi:hypothetical protein